MAMNQNEGYNYYYGVTDNADQIQWMKDIDQNIKDIIGKLKEHDDVLTVYRNVVNHNAEVLGEVREVVNSNAKHANNLNQRINNAGDIAVISLLGLGVVGGLIWLLFKGQDEQDNRISNLEEKQLKTEADLRNLRYYVDQILAQKESEEAEG